MKSVSILTVEPEPKVIKFEERESLEGAPHLRNHGHPRRS